MSPGGEAGYRVAQLDSQGGELIDPGGGFGFGDHNAIALDLVGGVAPVFFPVESDSSLAAAKADAFQAPETCVEEEKLATVLGATVSTRMSERSSASETFPASSVATAEKS